MADDAPRHTITVSAVGKAETVPDRAILPVRIEAHDKNLAAAKEQGDTLVKRLMKAVISNGIAKDKIKTSTLSISPRYRWEEQHQVFEDYQVSRSISITVDDLDKVEKLIADITGLGIDTIDGLQFTISHPEALEGEARKDAMKNAAIKAQELATAAGAKLGKVQSVVLDSEQHVASPLPIRAAMAQATPSVALPPPLPGTTTVEQAVTVVYGLE